MMWRIILFFVVIMCVVGAQLHDSGISEAEFQNMTARIGYDEMNMSAQFAEKASQNQTFLSSLVYKYADVLAFAGSEGARESMKFGYENPQYNFNLLYKLVILGLFAPLIIPTIYLGIFIGYAVMLIYRKIKEWSKGPVEAK